MTTFCKLPWQGIDISPLGDFKPCCKYNRPIANNLNDYLNSKELTELKRAFLNGEKPNACSRCWKDEEVNIKSKRQQTEESHLADSPVEDTIKIVSFAFGNICNLECRYCGSYSSSKWADTSLKLLPTIRNIHVFKHSSFYKDEELLEKLISLTKNATYLEFAGGEPFYSGVAEHKKYLKVLLENDPHLKTLQYITNGTVFPDDELLEIWSHFSSITIQISIDAIGKQFEYMRFPAKWDNVYANIKRYQSLQTTMTTLQLSISHTVGILNVFHVAEFIEWCEAEDLPKPYCGMVDRPNYFCIRNLPNHVKEKVKEKLKDKNVDNIIDYMMIPAIGDLSTLRNLWIDQVDKLRQQNFSEYFPEFSAILN